VRVPRAYVGTIKGSYDTSGGGGGDYEREEWSTSDVRFDRIPGYSDVSPRYTLAAGTVGWTFSGVVAGGQCTESGTATLAATGDGGLGTINVVAGRTQYYGGATYHRSPMYTLSCPGSDQQGQRDAYSNWFDTNGNYGTNAQTVNADGSLTGSVDEASSGITNHWEWSLTPVY
jgi:hypothetical protein